jgi:hypothetical protein
MGVKAEITWKRRTRDGERYEINVRRMGKTWCFYRRGRRFEVWERWDDPPLEEWLELLDGVRRRVARRLLRPEEETRLTHAIHERFPDAVQTS